MQRSPKVLVLTLTAFLFAAIVLAPAAAAETVVIPEDTMVYAVLPQQVTSKKKETNEGDVIHAHVWRDVVVDGEVVVAEGAELLLRVTDVKKARIFGRKGRLELEAFSVRAVDGTELPLTGFYYRSGKGRKVVTGTLAVAVAWPFAFLKGKNAKVPEGTVFSAYVLDDTPVRTWDVRAGL